MPDLGRYVAGSLWDLARSTGLHLDSTWAGQNLDTCNTQVTGVTTTWTVRQTTQGYTKGEPLYRAKRKWWWFKKTKLKSLGLRTTVYIQLSRSFKAPPEPNIVVTHPRTGILGMCHSIVHVIYYADWSTSPWLINDNTTPYHSHNWWVSGPTSPRPNRNRAHCIVIQFISSTLA